MIGNEVFRKYNVRPTIQVGVYFFALFSYLNILLPNLLRDLGADIFLASGVLALFVVILFIYMLSLHTFRVEKGKGRLLLCVATIFLFMNFLYFSNFIPPIPLSIREAGVYHEIERVNGNYYALTEKSGSYLEYILLRKRRHIEEERESIYIFSAVHAPEDMRLDVQHEWQVFDENERSFITVAEIPFEVTGGREEGYSWFTYYNAYPGRWRVNIRTGEGQIIGREDFYVIKEEGVERIVKEI